MGLDFALTLHQELSHRLSSVGFNPVDATVVLRGVVNDEDVFAAIFLEAVLERLIPGELNAVLLPGHTNRLGRLHSSSVEERFINYLECYLCSA